MNCPVCEGEKLVPLITKQGVEVDCCEKCSGVWLDKGEIYHFVKNPGRVAARLRSALKDRRPSERLSPASGQPMVELKYPGGPAIDFCKQSGGIWFDKGELRHMMEVESGFGLEIDSMSLGGGSDRARHAALKTGLLVLPNLTVRSAVTLTGLYAIMIAALIIAVEFLGLRNEYALLIGFGILVLQFVFSPFIMDISLRWLYSMRWAGPGDLPEHLRGFVEKVCAGNRMKSPRFGIIYDGAPQAFTYGHTPNNARIILSQGLLDLLDEREVRAVVAHEVGHAVHWDMLLMTLAQVVPLVLYYVYRTLINMKSDKRNNKGDGPRIAVAVGAYILYIVSEYVVLWFSRTREYHADRFAGNATGAPGDLSSALVKIAYGLAGQDKKRDGEKQGSERKAGLEAIGAMGIFDSSAARALAVTSFNAARGMGGEVDRDTLKGVMRWDLWNPWAKWYELNSTHPLVANRLRYLSDQAVHLGREPYVVFDERRPESYWDEFAVDLGIHLLPLAGIAAIIGSAAWIGARGGVVLSHPLMPASVCLLGLLMMLRYWFVYRGDYFAPMSVASLLKKVKVSAVRPVPCTVKGTVIGRGVPGYIFSEDFVMQDSTGIIFLDYRHPFRIWEAIFGLLKSGRYAGREVIVKGWYRRSPVPFIEVNSIVADGDVLRSWVPLLNFLTAAVVFGAGVLWLFAGMAG